jgi:small neutral amino acid transporter SnatA (MarC family)
MQVTIRSREMNNISFGTMHTHEEKSAMGKVVFGICLIWFVFILALALSRKFKTALGEKPTEILLAVISPVMMFSVC